MGHVVALENDGHDGDTEMAVFLVYLHRLVHLNGGLAPLPLTSGLK